MKFKETVLDDVTMNTSDASIFKQKRFMKQLVLDNIVRFN